jgi:thymidylate synthase ThyX
VLEYYREPFTEDEQRVLSRFFTNVDRPVFALINLPEVVKGALFARYSRTAKSLRRLFLDEFVTGGELVVGAGDSDPLIDLQRAERLYQRVFFEYGDDSVAQLGGVHLACEQASNILTKVLEWGRLAAYLEQSTRYVPYDVPLGDGYRYLTPPEIRDSPLAGQYHRVMEDLFAVYSELAREMITFYEDRYPPNPNDPPGVWKSTIKAKAYDAVRGLLPASTLSNVGIYATGQAYEMAILRMQAHPLAEVRAYGAMMLEELRKVVPSFLTRVDRPDRGGAWSEYLAATRSGLEEMAPVEEAVAGPAVTLTSWDPDGEARVAAAALYAVSELPDRRIRELVDNMTPSEREAVISALVGERTNRRHKPGRALEATRYRFDIVCDFGAFRDLQRHRLLTIEWQRLSTRLGYDLPPDLVEAGTDHRFVRLMERAGELYENVRASGGADVAQYAVPLAFNIRFVMEMNAREAMHLIELRSQPAGHPSYRAVAVEMHRLIGEVAGHGAIAAAMKFVDSSTVELERLEGERRAASRRVATAAAN